MYGQPPWLPITGGRKGRPYKPGAVANVGAGPRGCPENPPTVASLNGRPHSRAGINSRAIVWSSPRDADSPAPIRPLHEIGPKRTPSHTLSCRDIEEIAWGFIPTRGAGTAGDLRGFQFFFGNLGGLTMYGQTPWLPITGGRKGRPYECGDFSRMNEAAAGMLS
jgi:hypothetical protein